VSFCSSLHLRRLQIEDGVKLLESMDGNVFDRALEMGVTLGVEDGEIGDEILEGMLMRMLDRLNVKSVSSAVGERVLKKIAERLGIEENMSGNMVIRRVGVTPAEAESLTQTSAKFSEDCETILRAYGILPKTASMICDIILQEMNADQAVVAL